MRETPGVAKIPRVLTDRLDELVRRNYRGYPSRSAIMTDLARRFLEEADREHSAQENRRQTAMP